MQWKSSEQARDFALIVHVDAKGGGNLGQAGHGDDAARKRHHESRTGAEPCRANGEGISLRRAQAGGVVAHGILRLGDTHGAAGISVSSHFTPAKTKSLISQSSITCFSLISQTFYSKIEHEQQKLKGVFS